MLDDCVVISSSRYTVLTKNVSLKSPLSSVSSCTMCTLCPPFLLQTQSCTMVLSLAFCTCFSIDRTSLSVFLTASLASEHFFIAIFILLSFILNLLSDFPFIVMAFTASSSWRAAQSYSDSPSLDKPHPPRF